MSGISHFEYELTDIGYGTSVLIKKESNISSVLDSVRKSIKGKSIVFLRLLLTHLVRENSYFQQTDFTAPADGLYQVVLTCYDLAGNFKSVRQIFLYDNSSTIDITSGHRIIDTVSSLNTSNTWVVTPITSLSVEWDGHFVNSRHKNNQWLTGAKAYGGIDKTSKYDDNSGVITINSIDHEDGKNLQNRRVKCLH